MKRRRQDKPAFTLIEALLAMTILAGAAAGILLPFASGAEMQVEGMRRTIAAKLAADLAEEIIATPFADIVADYNYTELEGQIKDAGGQPFTDPIYAGFNRSVVSTPQGLFITVVIDVYYKGNQMAHIYTWIGS